VSALCAIDFSVQFAFKNAKIKTKLDNDGFHDDCLPFLQHIKTYATDETPPVMPYIGHDCCIIDVKCQNDPIQDYFHNQPSARKISETQQTVRCHSFCCSCIRSLIFHILYEVP